MNIKAKVIFRETTGLKLGTLPIKGPFTGTFQRILRNFQ